MAYGRRHYSKPQNDQPKKKGWNPNWKKQEPIVKQPYKPILHPTDQQVAIIEEFKNGTQNVAVRALAGCSKTSSTVEGLFQMLALHPERSTCYLAFGNAIAREAEAKVPAQTLVKTHHAFGLAAYKASMLGRKIEIDDDKRWRIVEAIVGRDDEQAEVRYNLDKAIEMAKTTLSDTDDEISNVIDYYGIDLCNADRGQFVEWVQQGLRASLQDRLTISFTEMLWLPIKLGVSFPQFDLVAVDEYQDVSKARAVLSRRAVKPGGRLVVLFDTNQAIFDFAGADPKICDELVEEMQPKKLSLTCTFRCAKKIVQLAQEIVPEYTAAENAPDGIVESISEQKMMEMLQPGDVVLSRTNAPLVGICMALIKEKRRAAIKGKDIGKGLLFMIKRSGASSVADFLAWLEDWKKDQCEKLAKRKKESGHIIDKFDVLVAVCEDARYLEDVRQNLRDLFEDVKEGKDKKPEGYSGVLLSSTHKFKGLENERVFLLADTYKRGKGAEEDRIWYVAVSRAKRELYLVSSGKIVNEEVLKKNDEEVEKENEVAM